MTENMKRGQKRPRTVEYAKRKRTETPETTKAPTVNPYAELGACTLITLAEHTSEFEQDKLDLIQRALIHHYRRERDADGITLPYHVWRGDRAEEACDQTMTALERAIVEAIE